MKITIATGPIFPVPAVRGGAVQRLWEGLAREFAKRGHEVTIFAREFPGQATEETVDGIRFVRRGGYAQSTSIKRDLVQCLLYALKTARHVPPGDVVVTNDFWMPAVLPRLKPSVGKVVPCLQRFPKNQGGLYSRCAALAAVSQAVADAVKVQSPSVASKVVVVPNAIDEGFLRDVERLRDKKTKRPKDEGTKGLRDDGTAEAEPRQVAAATNGPRDQRTIGLQDYGTTERQDGIRPVRILYVGRIHPEKGLALLANALKRMRQMAEGKRHEAEGGSRETGDRRQGTGGMGRGAWECVLVGPVRQSEGGGGEAFAEELKRQVDGLPVRFEAPVYDPAALANIYDEADVFVYPSVAETGESFGIAPLEAMARGVVPVVSDLAVFREYLEPGVNGMVFDHRSKDPAEDLAVALRELIGDADRRGQMAVAARTKAEKFSTAAIAERYLKLFAETLQSGT